MQSGQMIWSGPPASVQFPNKTQRLCAGSKDHQLTASPSFPANLWQASASSTFLKLSEYSWNVAQIRNLTRVVTCQINCHTWHWPGTKHRYLSEMSVAGTSSSSLSENACSPMVSNGRRTRVAAKRIFIIEVISKTTWEVDRSSQFYRYLVYSFSLDEEVP